MREDLPRLLLVAGVFFFAVVLVVAALALDEWIESWSTPGGDSGPRVTIGLSVADHDQGFIRFNLENQIRREDATAVCKVEVTGATPSELEVRLRGANEVMRVLKADSGPLEGEFSVRVAECVWE